MDWRIKATIQKLLSATRVGDKLNHYQITLNKKYHQHVVIYQTHECLRKFSYSNLDLKPKSIALEIGTGYSLISALVLALIGFEKVITVDVTKDVTFSTFKKQLAYLGAEAILGKIYAESVYSREEVNKKVNFIEAQTSIAPVLEFLNITYIAPYNFSDIEFVTKNVDYICSQVVLEHIHPATLDILFEKTKLWLNPGGFCVHTINFIDHFANPGFFQDKGISEFNFLKYSDKYWSFWANNPIAYTNRLSFLYYLGLCKKYSLKVADFIGENYRDRVELDKNLIHEDVIKKYENILEVENLTKYQRGTLIVEG